MIKSLVNGSIWRGSYQNDYDHDGLPYQLEILKNTNPRLYDTDGDSVSDREILFPSFEQEKLFDKTNNIVLPPDLDNDGLTNAEEINTIIFSTFGPDPTKIDTDNDGLSDKWEIVHGTDPINNGNSGEDNFQIYEGIEAVGVPQLRYLEIETSSNQYRTWVQHVPFEYMFNWMDKQDALISSNVAHDCSYLYSSTTLSHVPKEGYNSESNKQEIFYPSLAEPAFFDLGLIANGKTNELYIDVEKNAIQKGISKIVIYSANKNSNEQHEFQFETSLSDDNRAKLVKITINKGIDIESFSSASANSAIFNLKIIFNDGSSATTYHSVVFFKAMESFFRIAQITDAHTGQNWWGREIMNTPSTQYHTALFSATLAFLQDLPKIDSNHNNLLSTPEFVILSGDLIDDGSNTNGYKQLKKILLEYTIPILYIPGNHEYDMGASGRQNIVDYLSPGRYTKNEDSNLFDFSINYNNYHFQLFDAGYIDTIQQLKNRDFKCNGVTNQQRIWINNDILDAKTNKYTHTFIFTHCPIIYSMDKERINQNGGNLVNDFHTNPDYGVEAILSGHTHKKEFYIYDQSLGIDDQIERDKLDPSIDTRENPWVRTFDGQPEYIIAPNTW